MSLFTPNRLRGLLLLAGIICNPCRADWTTSTDLSVVRTAPAGGQVQGQNPPGFAWAQFPSTGAPVTYEVEVVGVKTGIQRFVVTRNWLLPEHAFAADSYTWRVKPSNGAVWSDARQFAIDQTSQEFVVPCEAVLKQRILARTQWRSLPPEVAANTDPAMLQARAALKARLRYEVNINTTKLAVPRDVDWPERYSPDLTPAYRAQAAAIRWATNSVGRQLESAAVLWRLRGAADLNPDALLAEAILRGDQFAALDPDGPTSFVNQDQGTRQIALALIKAVDLLGPDLDPVRRAQWLAAVGRRTAVIYERISGANNRLDQMPFDSHGGTNYGVLSTVATLALERIPAAETWFDYAFRGYANSLSPWGGADGGFANGSAYANYSADYFGQLWQPIAAASGVNLFAKPWAANFARFFAHFSPPGSPTYLFGDEHELALNRTSVKTYAARVASPAAAWYANSLGVADDALGGLQAAWPGPAAVTPAAPANAAVYPSIGWVALHSDLANPLRTSIYFKSSPYGSYNHSHADQNSLVINSGGKRLLIEAGQSDGYGTDQARDWYRQTKAHNAITVDGGQGQLLGLNDNRLSLGWNGAITGFRAGGDSAGAVDTASGNALPAYGPLLSRAVRQIWYLRDKDVLVVRDTLASIQERTFEWNMHALLSLQAGADGTVRIDNAERKLCIRSLSPGTAFAARTAPANAAGPVQVHGAFYNVVKSKSAEFVVVLDVGCSNPTLAWSGAGAGRTLWVERQELSLPE